MPRDWEPARTRSWFVETRDSRLGGNAKTRVRVDVHGRGIKPILDAGCGFVGEEAGMDAGG